MRQAISMLYTLEKELQQGRRIFITEGDGRPVEEIVSLH